MFVSDLPRQAAMRAWLAARGYRGGAILAVHTGAGHPLREWRDSHFDAVLRGLRGAPGFVVFVAEPGSPPEPWHGRIPHAQWTGGLAELKILLSVCDVFLGPDSGVMHMAAAAGCRVVAVFGPGEPRWFGPVGTGHSLVLDRSVSCRPCFDRCIHATALCLANIPDTAISAAVDGQLDQLRLRRAGAGAH